jgi:hypothetical protein
MENDVRVDNNSRGGRVPSYVVDDSGGTTRGPMASAEKGWTADSGRPTATTDSKGRGWGRTRDVAVREDDGGGGGDDGGSRLVRDEKSG